MREAGNEAQGAARGVVCAMLQSRLTDGIDLWAQARRERRRLDARLVGALRELFETVAVEVESQRVYPLETPQGRKDVAALADGLAGFSRHLRKDLGRLRVARDPNSVALLMDVSREADKYRWYLELHRSAGAA